MSDKKSNIKKIITIAVFVLLLIGAVYFYLSAPNNSDNSDGSDSAYDYSTNYSDYEKSDSTFSENSSAIQADSSSDPYSQSKSTAYTDSSPQAQSEQLKFRNSKLLNQHYEKHGIEMGFSSAEEYEKAAASVPYHPDVLHKIEKEDGDDVYYIEATNEFVVVSTDGYLRTYFLPNAGKSYFDKQ